jgi:frataxin-like iron-binding protein CyaY
MKNQAVNKCKNDEIDEEKRKNDEEKAKKRRMEAEKKKKEAKKKQEAEKKSKKDENDEGGSGVETPQAGGDTGIHGPTKTRTTESRLTMEAAMVISPKIELPKGEMLVAPCCLTKFEEPSLQLKFREQVLSAELKVYVCDYIPVKHLAAMTRFHDCGDFKKACNPGRQDIIPYDVRTSVEEHENYKKTNEAKSYGTYFPYLDKGLDEKKFKCHENLKGANTSEVENFLRDVSKGLNEVTGSELLNGDLEMHGLCIETVKPAHQRGHIDHALSYDVDELSFVGHMPLDQEGIVLRLENISSEMRDCLLLKEANLDEKVDVVDDILYIHVPFGSILVIDDRTFHGGHYCSPKVKRFHFVVSPRKWKNKAKGDRLLFLREAARQHTKKWREKKTAKWKSGGWDKKDDPQVAEPKLPIDTLNQMIEQIQYPMREKYYESFVEHCYPENTLDHLKRMSNLIPDYQPQVFKHILSAKRKDDPSEIAVPLGSFSKLSSSSSSSSSAS